LVIPRPAAGFWELTRPFELARRSDSGPSPYRRQNLVGSVGTRSLAPRDRGKERAVASSDQRDPKAIEATTEQVNDLFNSEELAKAVNTEEFRHFLDHIPIAIIVSKFFRGDQRICYANKAFETLTANTFSNCVGKNWSILAGFEEDGANGATLEGALQKGRQEFLGTFKARLPKVLVVEAYAGLIENEDGSENYRIVALIDVTDRARKEREEFIRQLRDKDMLLKELQHRVRNNLQLVVALIRLEARNERTGTKVNLPALAGRIESLQLLYNALSADKLGNEVDLGYYLSQIASTIVSAYAADGIRLDLKVDFAPVSVNVALSVGLLVNELVTNAFKYAFANRGSGLIRIECLHEQDRYTVMVADDGVGLLPGFVWPVAGKMGALIVQTFRENTGADIQVETAPNRGVKVTMTFSHTAPSRRLN
jgi:PAS domain S-box-containing protein